MVGVLIRMKLALMRNAVAGPDRAFWVGTGVVVGALLALATVWLSIAPIANPAVVPDLLAAVYFTWLIGWIFGPMFAGAPVLRAEHFTMLAIPRRRLAMGLLVAAFVGFTAALTLVAFASLITYAARLGVVPALLAVPVVALQVTGVVLLSRVSAVFFGRVARARTGAAINGVILAAILVLSQSGWMVLVGLLVSGVLDVGFPAPVAAALRVVPSGWGLAAIEAAAEGSWWLAGGAVAGLLALIVGLLAVWGVTLGEPRGGRAVIRGARRRSTRTRAVGATRAIFEKELQTWWRDPARIMGISGPIAYGLITALLPLTFGATLLQPWAGPLIALMAATFTANLYAYDGTALWLTLETGTERQDVRARQWAYLTVFTPITVLVAVAATAASGLDWAWPWVFAILPALLGGGVGLVALLSVVALDPGPDPRQRAENPLDRQEGVGNAFLVFLAALLPPLPAIGLVLAGTLRDDDLLRWAGVPAGLATGVLLAWWLGRIAYQRLRATGPELLFRLRSGKPSGTRVVPTAAPGAKPNQVIQTVGWTIGSIALFPQGLVPVVLKLTGNDDVRVWFLAMYVPGVFGWAIAAGMVAVGGYLYVLAINDLRRTLAGRGAGVPTSAE